MVEPVVEPVVEPTPTDLPDVVPAPELPHDPALAPPALPDPPTPPVPVPPVPVPVAVAHTAAGVLVLQARGESWVSVVDAKNVQTLQRTLAAGETITVTGTPPWSVTLGRADQVGVLVRGVPLNVVASTANSVARFTVK